MQNNYLDWIKKAEEDWRIIKAIVKSDYDPVSGILFHSQQCAEKYLKGFLSYKGIQIMKVHDLLQLHKLSLEVDSTFSLIKEPLIYLDGFSVAPRYPDEFEEYEIEDGIHAIKSVEIVREFCRIVLHLKNV